MNWRPSAKKPLNANGRTLPRGACTLFCWPAGRSGQPPRTMRRIKASIPVVTEKFAAYRTEQLADLWAKTLLDDAGVDVPETTEPL